MPVTPSSPEKGHGQEYLNNVFRGFVILSFTFGVEQVYSQRPFQRRKNKEEKKKRLR